MEQTEHKICSTCGLQVKIPITFKAPRGRCPSCGNLIDNPHLYQKQKNWPKIKTSSVETWVDSMGHLIAKLSPKFNELSVFFIGVAFILTFLAHMPQIVNWYNTIGLFLLAIFIAYIISASLMGIPFVPGLVYFVSGLACSLYHIFIKNKKVMLQKEKMFMAFFAVTTNFLTGIIGVYYMAVEAFEIKKPWLYIFPVWTLVNSLLLLPKYKSIEKNEAVIAEENASLPEIIFGLAVLMSVFGICNFGFKIHWPFTLSICVVYATIFSKSFGGIFIGKKRLSNLSEQTNK